MLMNTATEEIGHIEMLATAVAMNLEGAPTQVKEEAASDPIVAARLGGTQPRHVLSSGMGAMPVDANGAPFTGAFVVGTGNLGADMFANVHAEASGRLLAIRLYEATDDPGMKDMLSFLIARDTMHQQQWLAVIEEIKPLPVPNDFPPEKENQEHSYTFFEQSTAEVPTTRAGRAVPRSTVAASSRCGRPSRWARSPSSRRRRPRPTRTRGDPQRRPPRPARRRLHAARRRHDGQGQGEALGTVAIGGRGSFAPRCDIRPRRRDGRRGRFSFERPSTPEER